MPADLERAIAVLDAQDRPVHTSETAATFHHSTTMTRERWMALLFAAGALCFLVGPFPGYAAVVGEIPVAITFFLGSVLFTLGGVLQAWLAGPDRRSSPAGRAAWRTAVAQSAGTLFFNVSTFHALSTAWSDPGYNRLVWRPDALGSVCFLVSGGIAYACAPRTGWRPARTGPGWWEASVNLLGCVLFGIAGVAGYVVPATGSILQLAAANWCTSGGAACFLVCALATLRTGRTMKSSRFWRIRALERDIGWIR